MGGRVCVCGGGGGVGGVGRVKGLFVGWLFICPSYILVYPRDGSAQTISRADTLRQKAADPTFYLTQSQYTDTRPSD